MQKIQVGTENVLDQEHLTRYFRAFLMTKVKSYLAQVIRQQKISIFEIDERLNELSSVLVKLLQPDFTDYGLALERFFVTTIVKPDGENTYEKFKSLYFRQYADIAEAKLRQQTAVIDAETEAQKTVIASKAMATKRVQEGYTYQQERGFDVAEQAAQNEGIGEFTNMGIGLGVMSGIGGTVGGAVGGAVNEAMNSADQNPAEKSSSNDVAAFKAKLDKLTMMKDAGMLTEEEFNKMKSQLLASIL